MVVRRQAFPNAFSNGLSVFEQTPKDQKAVDEILSVVYTLYGQKVGDDYQDAPHRKASGRTQGRRLHCRRDYETGDSAVGGTGAGCGLAADQACWMRFLTSRKACTGEPITVCVAFTMPPERERCWDSRKFSIAAVPVAEVGSQLDEYFERVHTQEIAAGSIASEKSYDRK
jgi:hypothetical protein